MSDVPLVIGVGNRMRRDDGAGPAVLDALAGRRIEIAEVPGDCVRLIELWDGRTLVHVVDAMRSGADAGTIIRLDANRETVSRDSFLNTSHVFGVAEATALAHTLGRQPERLIVWGIEGADFDHGEILSAKVAEAVAEVAKRVAEETTGGADA